MEAIVYNIEGKETGRTVNLKEEVFGLENPNDHAIYQDIRLILARKRQGTHKAKERGEIKGTTKKPYRQKGTGNARAGSRKSPLWRHGGRVFGPRPRDYGFKLNKKTRALARKSALTYKAREEQLTVIENFEFESPKTKQFLEILSKFNYANKKTVLITPENNTNVYLSGRNLPKTHVTTAKDLNTYDILNADILLIMEDAVNVINERFSSAS
ncbi:MAG: 50S ribosomal protein L4 [Bacteroidetes bacterium]|nr:MAG: 50S ribosomal protein L4 [Bacteroidota bacterium]